MVYIAPINTDMETSKGGKDFADTSFDELYASYWKALYSTAFAKTGSHADSFDIVQDLFIHVWEKRHVIVVKESLEGYLFTSLRNRILNYFRNKGVKEKVKENYARFLETTGSGTTESGEQQVLRHTDTAALQESLNELPQKMRYIFVQNKFNNKSIRELSEELEIHPQTVKNQLTKARQKIEWLMKKNSL